MTFVEPAAATHDMTPPKIHAATPMLVPSIVIPNEDFGAIFWAIPSPIGPITPLDPVLLPPTATETEGRVIKLMDDDDDDDDLDDDNDVDDGFGDPGDSPSPGFGDDLDDDDDADDFDDIDEDDFDDDFDDDFEEELEDDYEIEIDDEISTEFGLNTAGEKEDDDFDDLDEFDDFDNIAR